MQIARIAPKTLPMESDGLPIVRLSDIEQNPDLERETDGKEDVWYDVCNNYQYRSSLLAPLQYENGGKRNTSKCNLQRQQRDIFAKHYNDYVSVDDSTYGE